MKENIAIYYRVSTTRQEFDSQKVAVERRVIADGFDIEEALVFEDNFTGKEMARPGFEELKEAIRFGNVDRLYVFRLDRVGRSLQGVIQFLQWLKNLKIRLICVQDSIDTMDDSPMGHAMRSIIAVFAELEGKIISQRVREGVAAARAAGKQIGRARTKPKEYLNMRMKAMNFLQRFPEANAEDIRVLLKCGRTTARDITRHAREELNIPPLKPGRGSRRYRLVGKGAEEDPRIQQLKARLKAEAEK